MAICKVCGKQSKLIASQLSLCLDCIRSDFKKVLPLIKQAHQKTRQEFGLPLAPPNSTEGIVCNLCVNRCKIPLDEFGFCGLRQNLKGKLQGINSKSANLSFYFDELPTNCVADWVCPAGTGSGYPEFANLAGPEYGFKNLSVFFHGCSFNCLFCQNWHFRNGLKISKRIQASELAALVDERTSCICYFGGDPTCQLPYSIFASGLALKNKKRKILRICWETNGSMNPNLIKPVAEIALESGGCIKFDLKSFSEELNLALCGVSNKQTLENFAKLSQFIKQRETPPLLVASTLLVPGYVDIEEVKKIAQFIAKLDPNIPYSLLAFYPCFYLSDLPTTSQRHAQVCLEQAKIAGLKNVRIGNQHLLGDDY